VDYFSKLTHKVTLYIFIGVLSIVVISGGVFWAVHTYVAGDYIPAAAAGFGVGVVLLYFLAGSVSRYITEPVKALSQAILHVTPGEHGAPAPNLDKIRVGRELVTNLSLQVYQLASHSAAVGSGTVATAAAAQANQAQAILDELPIPIFVSDGEQNITYANRAAAHYVSLNMENIIGKSMYSVLDFSFSNNQTLDAWLAQSRQNTVTASKQWDRVRLLLGDQTRKQCDLAAYYNKNNPSGAETVLALFDKTKYYGQDDDAIGFIALAVHELRTPLTILRGYIEVFDEELSDKLDPEMQDFMQKMQASAQQLSSFVSNILNVARIEEDQLFLQLHKEEWEKVLTSILADVELRAKVHGKNIVCHIEPGLPPVAVDRTSIYEVVNNLMENAIKYSGDSEKIIVKTYKRDDGMVETTIQDFGIGIPTSIIGNLFEKFYRNHRSRAQFGGTGLGLYLSKSIITAHGGQIWVQSKEDEGSTFGFTLQPYSELAKKEGSQDNKDIVRTAHGWIKNHSFYRR
jgi:two-component system sensor histidine kinase VicK